jgi:hypothetical protein
LARSQNTIRAIGAATTSPVVDRAPRNVDPRAASRALKFNFRKLNWFLIESAAIGLHP